MFSGKLRDVMRARLAAAVFALGISTTLASAHAESAEVKITSEAEVKTTPPGEGPRARWHPKYGAEIEGHGVVAGLDKYQAGLGAGVRVSVPIWSHAPFKSIDDDVSFGIGLDWVRYGAYKPREPNGSTVLTYGYYIPISLQWNVWLGARVSLFVEPTVIYRFATYPHGCASGPCVDTTRVLPTGFVGMRFRILDRLALTMRVGWPMFTLGASWL
jgi:hypothetical protein